MELYDTNSQKDTVKHTYTSSGSFKDSLEDDLKSDTDTVRANLKTNNTINNSINPPKKLMYNTFDDKRSHHRYKTWSKPGSGIQSQTDFTFGGERESITSPYILQSQTRRKRMNSLAPDKVEELPVEHTNGRMDTGSEKDSNLNIIGRHIFDALYDNHDDSSKINIMSQLYANDNEETQLIISDLESMDGIVKQRKSQISEESVKRLMPSKQDLGATMKYNSHNILSSAVGEILSKKFSLRNPSKKQRDAIEALNSKTTDSMNSNKEADNDYKNNILIIKERIINKIQNKKY
jgi:hypothetical protein